MNNARDEIRALVDSPVAHNYHMLSTGERAAVDMADIADAADRIETLLPRISLGLRTQVRAILTARLCDG